MESHKGGGDDSDGDILGTLCPRPEDSHDWTGNCNAIQIPPVLISALVGSVAPPLY